MKCVVDLDLLNPPPLPDTPHFGEMLLHQRKLGEARIKIALSQQLQEMLWSHWNQVSHPQHRDFLLHALTRFCASDYPNALTIETDQVYLNPQFLPSEPEWVDPWLHSLMACYLDAQFNTGGALLATWPRDEFAGRQDVQMTYQGMVEKLPIVRDEAEWDALLAELDRLPIPFTSNLCVYADESGSGHDEWIAVIVISEKEANEIAKSAMAAFNQSKPPGWSDVDEIHLSQLARHGARRRERAQQRLAELVVEGICNAHVACFIVTKRPGESQTDLYARGLREALRAWWPDLIHPIHIDTPYDRKDDDVKNYELRRYVFDAIHGEDFGSLSRDDIVLSKATYYPGLGIADAVAYLYRRCDEPFWKDLWQRLQSCVQLV
jgi:hypothetical protein